MWPFRGKPGLLPGPPQTCLHEHWEIRGTNTYGSGQCLDCGKELHLITLLNALHDKMERLIRKYEEKLRRIP